MTVFRSHCSNSRTWCLAASQHQWADLVGHDRANNASASKLGMLLFTEACLEYNAGLVLSLGSTQRVSPIGLTKLCASLTQAGCLSSTKRGASAALRPAVTRLRPSHPVAACRYIKGKPCGYNLARETARGDGEATKVELGWTIWPEILTVLSMLKKASCPQNPNPEDYITKPITARPVYGSLAKDLGTLIKKPVLHDWQKRRFAASPPANMEVELPGYPRGQTIPKSHVYWIKSHLQIIKESELTDHGWAANPFCNPPACAKTLQKPPLSLLKAPFLTSQRRPRRQHRSDLPGLEPSRHSPNFCR